MRPCDRSLGRASSCWCPGARAGAAGGSWRAPPRREATPHAALVVDTGGQTLTYCVALDAQSVSGLRLIQLARRNTGCSTGSASAGRRSASSPASARPAATASATTRTSGATGTGAVEAGGRGPDRARSASVGDGDVEGWSWGSGDSGTTHPAPPALSFDDVCDDPTPPGDDGGGGGSGGGGGVGGGAGAPAEGDGSGGGGDGGGGGGGSARDGAGGDAHGDGARRERPEGAAQGGGRSGNDDGEAAPGSGPTPRRPLRTRHRRLWPPTSPTRRLRSSPDGGSPPQLAWSRCADRLRSASRVVHSVADGTLGGLACTRPRGSSGRPARESSRSPRPTPSTWASWSRCRGSSTRHSGCPARPSTRSACSRSRAW